MGKTLIIAEIGECFNGSLATAKKMMRMAKKAGCDFAKFQTLDYEAVSELDPEKDWLRKIALNPKKIGYLTDEAKKIKIGILFTPANVKTAQWLLDLRCRDIKIASSCITDMKLIDFVNSNFRRVFLSTGMASINEVHRAVKAFDKIKDLYIMHCVSEYPTGPLLEERGLKSLDPEGVRLNMMLMLMKMFPMHKIGYSDHTREILPAVSAVAMGARVIEKHVTLDRKAPIENFKAGKNYLGTDHVLSLEPGELKEMVGQIRQVEKMFGPQHWERSEGEKSLRNFIRGRFRK